MPSHSFSGVKSSSYPKAGIRPTIDGRLGGVRESLEERTMQQARAVAELIARELRYPDGTPVQCVIADTGIGGVKEAAHCTVKFKRENAGVSPTVTPCWCCGSETMDMDPHLPKAVWGFNGTERPGAVYLAAVLAGHTQKGLPAFGIYGKDYISPETTRSREQIDREWKDSVKMALIARDLMEGNPRLSEMGRGEQAQGHNAIAAGFRACANYGPL